MGFERREKNKKGPEKRTEFLFSNSPIIKAGGIITDDTKAFLRCNYSYGSHTLHGVNVPGYNQKIGYLIFSNNSPLVQKDDDKTIDLENYRKIRADNQDF